LAALGNALRRHQTDVANFLPISRQLYCWPVNAMNSKVSERLFPGSPGVTAISQTPSSLLSKVEQLCAHSSSLCDPVTVNAAMDRLRPSFCGDVVSQRIAKFPVHERDIDESTFRHLIARCDFNPNWIASALKGFNYRVDIIRSIVETFESKVPRPLLSSALSSALFAAATDEVGNRDLPAVSSILGRPECDG
jgi:hypothetical protein